MKKENDGQILGEELLILIKDQSSRLEANKN